MKSLKKRFHLALPKRAFTIIELLIAVIVITMITSVSVANYRNGEKSKRVAIAADSLVSSLRAAQSYVVSGKSITTASVGCATPQYYYMQFDFNTQSYTLNAIDKCNNPATIATYSLPVGTKIQTNGLSVDGSNASTLRLTFSPPFGTTKVSINGGADITFKSALLTVATTDGQIKKIVELDGVSGRIGEYVPPPAPSPSPSPGPSPSPSPGPGPSPSPTPPPPSAPDAPTGLTASPVIGSPNHINLSWTTPVNNGGATVTSYKIYRGTSPGGESSYATSSNTTYSDNVVALGTTYYYKVSAINSVGEGSTTTETGTKMAAIPNLTTNAATNITATTATLNGNISPNDSSATAWFRYSPTNPGSCSNSFGSFVGSGTNGSYTFGLTGLTGATTYYYCAIGYNSIGNGYGSILSFTTGNTYLSNITQLDSGGSGCAIVSGGNFYCWMGSGTPAPLAKGEAVAADNDGTNLSNMKQVSIDQLLCGVSNGNLPYCWGRNLNGALGINNTDVSYSTPTPVRVLKGAAAAADTDGTYLTNIKQISTNVHVCAVSIGGNVYCWGDDQWGEDGDNVSTVSRFVPVRVLKGSAAAADTDGTYLTNIKQVESAQFSTCAISNGGNAYCWGDPQNGELGNNKSSGSYYTPQRVLKGAATGADTDGTNLINIKQISANDSHSCAVANSGLAYCWGSQSYGMLGNNVNSSTAAKTPVLVLKGGAAAADTDGTYLTHVTQITTSDTSNYTCAITSNLNSYCWGSPIGGSLGGNESVDTTTPSRVWKGEATGSDTDGTYLTNITAIFQGAGYNSCALAGSGYAYCWGGSVSGTPFKIHNYQ